MQADRFPDQPAIGGDCELGHRTGLIIQDQYIIAKIIEGHRVPEVAEALADGAEDVQEVAFTVIREDPAAAPVQDTVNPELVINSHIHQH